MNDYKNLNTDQKKIYKSIINRLKKDKLIKKIILGSAGTGKSFLIETLKKDITENFDINIILTAYTGIAACNINTNNINSIFGLNLDYNISTILCKKNDEFYKYKLKINDDDNWIIEDIIPIEYIPSNKIYINFDKKNLLIIDEISTISYELYNILDNILRCLFKNNKKFGKCDRIFLGDFLQLPPVKKEGLLDYNIIKYYTIHKLTISMRNNNELFNLCENIRRIDTDKIYKILKDRDCKNFDPNEYENSIRLFNKNIDCYNYNQKKLQSINHKKIEFNVDKPNKFIYEIKNSTLNFKSTFLKKCLILCKDAQVMITKNINETLKNGTIGTIVDIKEFVIYVKVNDLIHLITPIKDVIEDDGKILYTISNFPLTLSWAITIHKCQGLTLNSIYLTLYEMFDYRLFYVGISRVKDINKIYIDFINDKLSDDIINDYKKILINMDKLSLL